MSFSVGIIGLPNAGKSTLFKALTRKKVDIASYPFTTIEPNVGIVAVPDKRLDKIASIIKPEKTTPTIIEFIDIAGLVEGAHKGEGLGNQFLSHIRVCDATIEVVRTFKGSGIEEEINPEKDIKIIKNELLMKDIETLEGNIEKLEKQSEKKLTTLKRIKENIKQGKLISEINLNKEEKTDIKEYQFLTIKPKIYIFNTQGKIEIPNIPNSLAIDLKIEEEASELSPLEISELEIQSKLDQLIIACYNTLDLITFFTITGNKETKAWTLKRGLSAIDSARKVHTDFAEKFIKAEIIPWQKLIEAGSWVKAREMGQLKTVGKEYIIQDSDIIEFKI